MQTIQPYMLKIKLNANLFTTLVCDYNKLHLQLVFENEKF